MIPPGAPSSVDDDAGTRPARAGAVLSVTAALAVLAATTAVELRVAGRSVGDLPGDLAESGYGLAVTGVLMASGAAAVLWRARPGEGRGFGWALTFTGLFWGLDGVAQSWVRLGVVEDRGITGLALAAWFLFRFTAFLPLSVVVLPLLFPEGRFPRGGWRAGCWATVVVLSLSALSFIVVPAASQRESLTLPGDVDQDLTTIHALAGIGGGLVTGLQLASLPFVAVVPLGVVVHRYRRAEGVERDRMRWLLWSVLTVALVGVFTTVVDVGRFAGAFALVGVSLVPIAMSIAIVTPRLVSIDDLLGRTVLYGGLAVALVAVDLVVLAALTSVLGDALAQRQVVVLVLLVSVLLYGPLRVRLASAVRRRVLGDRENPFDTVAGLASTLEATDDPAAQMAAVARTVAQAFGVRYVRVEVERGGEHVVATHGDEPAHTRTLPISYRGSEVGRLVLPARGVRSRLTRRDEQLLGDLVRQAVTAVRTGQLADELQDSRERLVVAREEERRRIRRDLHDGLGPALSGVVFQLESARLQVASDPAAATASITRTSGHLQDVVADVRRLVHDLRPPALDDRGLVGALRQQAEALSGVDGVRFDVEADGVDDLPAAVEVASFRIAGEAMTNVVRHAGARSASVRLCGDVAPGALDADDALDAEDLSASELGVLVEVVDDGVGIPPDVQAGVGLVSLRERAAELGGRTEITCPATGGTAVRAWLPLRSAR